MRCRHLDSNHNDFFFDVFSRVSLSTSLAARILFIAGPQPNGTFHAASFIASKNSCDTRVSRERKHEEEREEQHPAFERAGLLLHPS